MSRRFGLVVVVMLVLLAGVQSSGLAQQSAGIWTAQYFDNTTLSGNAIVTQNETSPNHNWGKNAPEDDVPKDEFSVRWSTSEVLYGTYRLTVKADDGVRVYIGADLVVDNWVGSSGVTTTKELTYAYALYVILVEYYDNTGNASISYSLEKIADTSSSSSSSSSTSSVPSSVWEAQYYNNATLSGNPVLTWNESSPNHNWGTGAPVQGVNADYFSARWARMVALDGWYTLQITADDGVRAWVNGVNVIDEWHNSTGINYSHTFSLPSGTYLIVIEYYEETGAASISYSLTATTDPGPGSGGGAVVVPSGPRVIVNTSVLNVRDLPTTLGSFILTKIHYGEAYVAVGRTVTGNWWQIQVGDTVGWVYGPLVSTLDTASVPVTFGVQSTTPVTTTTTTNPIVVQPANTNTTQNIVVSPYSLGVRANLNIRKLPDVNSDLIGRINYDQRANIIARNSRATWWLVEFNGLVGWVNGYYVVLPYGLDYSQVPVR